MSSKLSEAAVQELSKVAVAPLLAGVARMLGSAMVSTVGNAAANKLTGGGKAAPAPAPAMSTEAPDMKSTSGTSGAVPTSA